MYTRLLTLIMWLNFVICKWLWTVKKEKAHHTNVLQSHHSGILCQGKSTFTHF